jgi:threonine dehydratase
MSRGPLTPPELADIEAARRRLAGVAIRTPLLPLAVNDLGAEIYLKPELLQPIGSFKIRGAGNALLAEAPENLAAGVYTASAGNMAQGVAWVARRLGVPATAIVPDHAPQTKLAAIERLEGSVLKVTFERWWQVIQEHHYPGLPGRFVHPVSDRQVMAGNGTIGLELLDDLPDVDTVFIPWGGGGLACGIAAALRGRGSQARIIACEVETAEPVAAALAAGEPREVDYRPSFVDGIGGKSLLPEMWPLARQFVTGTRSSSLAEIADAIRLLAERHRIIAEGAGAAALAAALGILHSEGGKAFRKAVCIVSGGNLDTARLLTILAGGVP